MSSSDSGHVLELQRQGGSRGVRVRVTETGGTGAQLADRDGLSREGVLLDLSCPYAPKLLRQATAARAFNYRYSWLLLHNASFDQSMADDLLAAVEVLPDADVIWATANLLLDVYRVKSGEPLIFTPLPLGVDSTQENLTALWDALPPAPTRRKNLNNVYLKAVTTITQPQHFKGWTDLTKRHIDTFPKLTYPMMMLCAEDLNFRYNLRQVDLYGEKHGPNGTFDGLAGLLQRNEVEVGVSSIFMRVDRLSVMHFCAETLELRGAFMFRQPSQSAVNNVFLLPFSRGVWAASFGVFAAAAALLATLGPQLARADLQLTQLSAREAVTFTVGTICQQGSYMNPQVLSARLVMFVTLLASVFTFTAYSAKIVAILQTPSNAIQTIDDLRRSSMTLGVQETTYKRVYFAESNDPATQRLYRTKLLPLGDRAYLSVVDGIARMRTGLFAFQVEESSGYDIISKTYTEREKCGLQQIKAFTLPMVAVPLRKHSGYRELFSVRLRWQREVGLMRRQRHVWMSSKPRCDAEGAGFLSVGIVDVLPAVQVLAGGALLSVVLLGMEIVASRCRT